MSANFVADRMRIEFNTVLLVIFYAVHHLRVFVKDEPIFVFGGNHFRKDYFETLGRWLTRSKQINITCGSVEFFCPAVEQRTSIQDE